MGRFEEFENWVRREENNNHIYCPNPKIFPIANDVYNRIMDEARRVAKHRIVSSDTSNSKPYNIVRALMGSAYSDFRDMQSRHTRHTRYAIRKIPTSIDKKVALTLIKKSAPHLNKHRSTGYFSTMGDAKSYTNIIKFAKTVGISQKELNSIIPQFTPCYLNISRDLAKGINAQANLPSYQAFITLFSEEFIRKNLKLKVKNLGSFQGQITFNVLGCQGVADKTWAKSLLGKYGDINAQKNIGAHMSRNDASFNILLGDNVYEYGVIRKDDSRFSTCFHDIYKNKPSFLIQGNHEYHITGVYYSVRSMNPKRYDHDKVWVDREKLFHLDKAWNQALYQCQHTYDKMNDRHGGNWNMPHRYYCIETDQAIFYMIDSNTFLLDSVQQQWLKDMYDSYDGANNSKWNILCTHHPLQSYGKRGGTFNNEYPRDGKPEIAMYTREFGLHDTDQEAILVKDKKDKELGSLIRKCFDRMGISFNLVFAAHDHFFSSGPLPPDSHGNKTHQIVIGCGGAYQGQDIKSRPLRPYHIKTDGVISHQRNVPAKYTVFGIKAYGYTEITASLDEIKVDFYAVNFSTSYLTNLGTPQGNKWDNLPWRTKSRPWSEISVKAAKSKTLLYSCRIPKDQRRPCEHSFSSKDGNVNFDNNRNTNMIVELQP
ncbi:MAG: hypothetical protein GY710_04835 [Desulfobacteraceae bacterium]|nr:hypothetical protein [Desulfobacteraceae bacterium]